MVWSLNDTYLLLSSIAAVATVIGVIIAVGKREQGHSAEFHAAHNDTVTAARPHPGDVILDSISTATMAAPLVYTAATAAHDILHDKFSDAALAALAEKTALTAASFAGDLATSAAAATATGVDAVTQVAVDHHANISPGDGSTVADIAEFLSNIIS
jgi:hypothetical protein